MRVFMAKGASGGNVVVFYNLTANGGFSNRLPRGFGAGTEPRQCGIHAAEALKLPSGQFFPEIGAVCKKNSPFAVGKL